MRAGTFLAGLIVHHLPYNACAMQMYCETKGFRPQVTSLEDVAKVARWFGGWCSGKLVSALQ